MTTIWDVVAAQAARSPDAVAVRGPRDQSYRELIEQAAQLAGQIGERTGAGRVLAMQVHQPSMAAVVLLAAARCHCPVLPLSADSPPAHRGFVLADARPVLLVRGIADGSFELEDVDLFDEPSTDAPDLTEAAYVIYTSGSTGRPKGVVVGHRALLSRLEAFAQVPGFGPRDSVLAMTAPSFDISLIEFLLPLTVGGCLIAAPAGAALDPAIFAAAVSAYRPSVIQATPSFWRLALAWGWSGSPGSRLWCGGEALTSSLGGRLLATAGTELWNLYGPTEATIWASAARVRAGRPIDLGAPVPGARLCLAGEDGEPVTGPHRPGELLLYGDGLAIGYLNRPELTAERFHTCRTPDGPRRCYRTGDLAQYREDASLQFLGRNDGQVKVRGHRVELPELEAVAEEHPGVLQAAAVLRDTENPQRTHIALFVVGNGRLTDRQVRRWLALRLPPSLRPGRILFRDSLPRTTAGKLDRVALADLG